jgi:hypothetical protein
MPSNSSFPTVVPTLLVVVLCISAAAAEPAVDRRSDPAATLLDRAFHLRYDVDIVQDLSIALYYQDVLVAEQRIELAGKRIAGRYHAIGRYRRPAELRGTAVLVIEATDRLNDHFVFLPSLKRIRRISSAQRADSFFGTDLSYEDISPLRVRDFALSLGAPRVIEAERTARVIAEPLLEAGYERAEFFVSERDAAILETHYFIRGGEEPFKVVRFRRAGIQKIQDRLIPTHIQLETPGRRTRTEIETQQLIVNPELDASLFSAAALESARAIPGLGR